MKLYKISAKDYKYFKVSRHAPATIEAYFRCIPDFYLADDIKYILYLDSDTICLDDISELFEYDLKNYAFGAVTGWAPEYRKENLGLKHYTLYCNTGVLLINMDYWRKNNITRQLIEFHNNIDIDVLERNDQDVINAVLKNKWLKLPLKYNCNYLDGLPKDICANDDYLCQFSENEIEEAQNNLKILHYTGWGQHKPWYKDSLNKKAYLYQYYFNMTPFRRELPLYAQNTANYGQRIKNIVKKPLILVKKIKRKLKFMF